MATPARLAVLLLSLWGLSARADEGGAPSDGVPEAVEPASPMPSVAPPPAPDAVPSPPGASAETSAADSPASGQWVYTSQYGWVWMPYGDYSFVPPDGTAPDMYVYYPPAGWCWVVAPWIWGFGPMPYFGVYGPSHFRWWGFGYGRRYGFPPPHGGNSGVPTGSGGSRGGFGGGGGGGGGHGGGGHH